MFDRAAFSRPFAHRGLHDSAKGIIENTRSAFVAALEKGYGIECDLQPASGGLPIVFHDETMDRLLEADGPTSELLPTDLAWVPYKGRPDERVMTYAALLDLVDGRVPLLVEIKSEWDPPNRTFLAEIARLSSNYRGPIALMSFDPAVITMIKQLAPSVPRGIVSGSYRGDGWWADRLDDQRRFRLANLLESDAAEPQFYAYEVAALPTRMTSFARDVQRLPLFTWTVRSDADRKIAKNYADAPIFEGFEP